VAVVCFIPLNAKLNLIWHLLALLGAHHILYVSRARVKTVFQLCLERNSKSVKI